MNEPGSIYTVANRIGKSPSWFGLIQFGKEDLVCMWRTVHLKY